MPKLSLKRALTSKILRVYVQKISDGRPLTGLTFSSGSLTAYYILEGAAAPVVITLVTATVGTWTSSGFIEIHATNLPGWYELHLPNAALASGNSVGGMLKGASDMLECPFELALDAVDVQDAVRGGMTALPAVAAGANGGLPTGNASGQTTVATVATGAIVAGSFAAGAIDAAAIATDAIGSAELAASAATEIAAAVRVDLTTELGRVDVAVSTRNAVAPDNATITAIGTRIPAALVSGRMDSSVGAMAADVLTATALAASAVTEIQSGAATASAVNDLQTDLDDVQSRLPAALVGGRIDSSVGAIVSGAVTAIVDGVWNAVASAYNTALSMGNKLNGAASAGDPWSTAVPGAYGAGTAGNVLGAINTVVDTEIAAIKTKTDNLPASPAATGGLVTLTLTQAIPTTNTAQTVGDALNAARAQGFGRWSIIGTSWILYAADGTTVVRTFVLDDAALPTSRT